MASKFKTKEIDRGFKSIVKELRKLENKPHVKVGYPLESKKTSQAKKNSEDLTVLDIAIFHEFGTVHLPERSFIRAAFDKNKRKYIRLNKKLLKKIYSQEMTVEKALDILGEVLQNDIKDFIVSDNVKPPTLRSGGDAVKSLSNELENIARTSGLDAGASKTTLVDTGQMLNAITYKRKMSK